MTDDDGVECLHGFFVFAEKIPHPEKVEEQREQEELENEAERAERGLHSEREQEELEN